MRTGTRRISIDYYRQDAAFRAQNFVVLEIGHLEN